MPVLREDTQEVLRIFCHELAGPLTSVQGHVGHLMHLLMCREVHSLEHVARTAESTARALTWISSYSIRLLTNFSWLAYPDQQLELEREHDPAQLLESCAKDVEHLGTMRQIAIRIDRESVNPSERKTPARP